MKPTHLFVAICFLMLAASSGFAYPPAVGILGTAKNCLACHVDNGGCKDDGSVVIDILDKATGKSLRQPDGSFKLVAWRGKPTTILTIIGYQGSEPDKVPYRNAWLYVAPETIGGSDLSKFAPGWDVNLPMACRLVGDKTESYPDAQTTVLPMTVLATGTAHNGIVQLQVMLTKGETIKGKPKEGMLGSYFERVLRLEVHD